MRRLLLSIALLVLFVTGGMVAYNTATFVSVQIPATPVAPCQVPEKALERLSLGLQIPTVSRRYRLDTAAVTAFHRLLDTQYVHIRAQLRRSTVNRYGLLYKWEGRDPNLKPILLMAHFDVVPVDSSEIDAWTRPPFSGALHEGYLYGRGAIDDKSALFAILEAVELLLAEGTVPQRTVYLLFGQDEEVGGKMGGQAAALAFEQAGIRFEYVLDEGTHIATGLLPGTDRPVALVSIGEKGYLTLRLQVQATGGHSSLPPAKTAIGSLAAALTALAENPMPAHLDGPIGRLFDFAGPEMDPWHRALFANRWLSAPYLTRTLSRRPEFDALLRTSTAPTVIEGGFAENVLPTGASATVNFRILPGETVSDVVQHVRRVVGPEVRIDTGAVVSEPPPLSPTDAYGFRILQTTLRQLYPEVVVAPSLMTGATDARHFTRISEQLYRFAPVEMRPDDYARIHGRDERIGADNFRRMVRFYHQLLKNSIAQ
jgi:carboxypeptidase PM20D1